MHVQQNDLDTKDKKGLPYLLISASSFELRELKHFTNSPRKVETSRYFEEQELW